MQTQQSVSLSLSTPVRSDLESAHSLSLTYASNMTDVSSSGAMCGDCGLLVPSHGLLQRQQKQQQPQRALPLAQQQKQQQHGTYTLAAAASQAVSTYIPPKLPSARSAPNRDMTVGTIHHVALRILRTCGSTPLDRVSTSSDGDVSVRSTNAGGPWSSFSNTSTSHTSSKGVLTSPQAKGRVWGAQVSLIKGREEAELARECVLLWELGQRAEADAKEQQEKNEDSNNNKPVARSASAASASASDREQGSGVSAAAKGAALGNLYRTSTGMTTNANTNHLPSARTHTSSSAGAGAGASVSASVGLGRNVSFSSFANIARSNTAISNAANSASVRAGGVVCGDVDMNSSGVSAEQFLSAADLAATTEHTYTIGGAHSHSVASGNVHAHGHSAHGHSAHGHSVHGHPAAAASEVVFDRALYSLEGEALLRKLEVCSEDAVKWVTIRHNNALPAWVSLPATMSNSYASTSVNTANNVNVSQSGYTYNPTSYGYSNANYDSYHQRTQQQHQCQSQQGQPSQTTLSRFTVIPLRKHFGSVLRLYPDINTNQFPGSINSNNNSGGGYGNSGYGYGTHTGGYNPYAEDASSPYNPANINNTSNSSLSKSFVTEVFGAQQAKPFSDISTSLLSHIHRAKFTGTPPHAYPADTPERAVLLLFNQLCYERGVITFSDMVPLATRLLHCSETVRAEVRVDVFTKHT